MGTPGGSDENARFEKVWVDVEMSSGMVSCSQAQPPHLLNKSFRLPTNICLVDLPEPRELLGPDICFLAAYLPTHRVRSQGESIFQAAKLKFTLKQLIFWSMRQAVFPWQPCHRIIFCYPFQHLLFCLLQVCVPSFLKSLPWRLTSCWSLSPQ